MSKQASLQTYLVWLVLSQQFWRDHLCPAEYFLVWCLCKQLYSDVDKKDLKRFRLYRIVICLRWVFYIFWSSWTIILQDSTIQWKLDISNFRKHISSRLKRDDWCFSWCFFHSLWYFSSCSWQSHPYRLLSWHKISLFSCICTERP